MVRQIERPGLTTADQKHPAERDANQHFQGSEWDVWVHLGTRQRICFQSSLTPRERQYSAGTVSRKLEMRAMIGDPFLPGIELDVYRDE